MKRFFNFALVLAAISFAACTNDLTEDQGFAPNVGGGSCFLLSFLTLRSAPH